MQRFGDRMKVRLSTLVIAFGLVLGLTTSMAVPALALPTSPLSSTDDCYYDGKKYSEGSVIVIGGTKYECDSGEWDEAIFLPPTYGTGWDYSGASQEMAPTSYYP